MRTEVFHTLAKAAADGEPVALAIIAGVKGSSPQKSGSKAVFFADGRLKGTVGGGCLEAEIQKRAIHCLRTGKPASFELLLDHDFGWDDGLVCGGKVTGLILPNAQAVGADFWAELSRAGKTLTWGIRQDFQISAAESPTQEWLYQETVYSPCALWIAGAGHIAQAVAPLAVCLDFSVTVFDDRPALASPNFFPPDVALMAARWEELLITPVTETPTFGLIVTRGHRHDALVLKEWIHKGFVFLGMIGSSRKARTIFCHFEEEKIASREELSRIACPVGIKIRSQTVHEIAVSIMAQYIDKRAELVYAGRPGGSGWPRECPSGPEDFD